MNEFLNLLLPWWWGPINWITDSFISVIVLYAIVSGIWFWVKTFFRRSLIDSLTEEVRQYDGPAQPSIKHQLKEKFEHNTALKDAWREFEDSLIEGKRPGNQEDENQEVVYKTDEASLFFSEERLLDQHLNLRFWNSVPALLVGLGILGTFVGMVWGLIPFSDVDFTNTNQIREAIKELLSGVSTAFVTSVWGMLASFLFNGLEKWGIGRVSRAIADLQHALDQIFTLTRAEEIAMRQQNELAQQTAALKSLSTDLANRIKKDMDNIMSERLDALHESLTGWHEQNTRERQEIIRELRSTPEAFSNALEPSLTRLNTAAEKLLEYKGQSSIEAIEQLVEEFQKSLSGSVMEQIKTLAERLGTVSESLINLPDQMEEMIASVQKQIDQTRKLLGATSEEQAKQMTQMFGEMNEEMRKMVTDVHKLVESVADKMKAVSDQTIRTLQEAIAQLQRALDSTASQTSAEFEEMTRRMRELVDHSATRLDNIFKNGEQSVGILLQQQGKQTEAINAQLKNWQNTLTEGQEMFERIDTSVTSVRQLIETTERLSGQLMEGATQIESAGQSLTRASEAFNQENERYLIANRETTTQIQNVLGQSQRLLNDSVQRFQTIDNGLQGIFAEIERGLNEYTTTTSESINTYLGDFSNQLTLASTALARSVEALGENVEILNDMIERLPRR